MVTKKKHNYVASMIGFVTVTPYFRVHKNRVQVESTRCKTHVLAISNLSVTIFSFHSVYNEHLHKRFGNLTFSSFVHHSQYTTSFLCISPVLPISLAFQSDTSLVTIESGIVRCQRKKQPKTYLNNVWRSKM